METTVLIVDENPYIVDGLVALLKRKGFSTVACHGGGEALTALMTITPDFILLNFMMEPMDS